MVCHLKNILTNKGGQSLLSATYENSHQKAIMSIYPEFDLKPWLFSKTQKDFWNKKENQVLIIRAVHFFI